jgi:hypothetical protein
VLSVLFALSRVLRVSFVCSLALVHVFRGELVSFLLLCSFASGVEPFCLCSRSQLLVSFLCGWFPELVFGAPCVAYV